jgi:hypothetical protein
MARSLMDLIRLVTPRRSVKPRNKERHAKNWTRAYDSPEFVAWIREQPSIVSGKGPCVAAHSRTGGTRRKADACWNVPLTQEEHDELHDHGIKTFEAKYGVSLAFHAPLTWQRWLAFSGAAS